MIVNSVFSKLEIKYESYIFQMHAICNYLSVSIYHFDLGRGKKVLIRYGRKYGQVILQRSAWEHWTLPQPLKCWVTHSHWVYIPSPLFICILTWDWKSWVEYPVIWTWVIYLKKSWLLFTFSSGHMALYLSHEEGFSLKLREGFRCWAV